MKKKRSMSKPAANLKSLVAARRDRDVQALRAKLPQLQHDTENLRIRYLQAQRELSEAEEKLQELLTTPLVFAMTAPIYRLPVEILASIFTHGVADWEDGAQSIGEVFHPDWWDLGEWLQAITGVSRQWRAVAMRTPNLWRVCRSDMDHVIGEGRYYPWEVCMERNSCVPLVLWAGGTGIINILRSLESAKGLSRVKSLHLRGVWFSQKLNADEVFSACMLCGLCSRLELLSLSSFSNVPKNQFLEFLASLVMLRKLIMTTCHTTFDPERYDPAILTNLDVLELYCGFKYEIEYLIPLVWAPNLRRLVLTVDEYYEQPDTYELECPPGRFESVTELVLKAGGMTTRYILSVLSHTPKARVLRIYESHPEQESYDDLLQALCSRDGSENVLLPHLQVIGLAATSVSLPALGGLVDSRTCNPHGGIKSVLLDEDLLKSVSDLPDLLANVKISQWQAPDL